jgi:hypothetical protein
MHQTNQRHIPPCSSVPTHAAQLAIQHVCRAPPTSPCAMCQTNAFRHSLVCMNWDACPQSARRLSCCCAVAIAGTVLLCTLAAARQKPALPRPPDVCSKFDILSMASFLLWQDCMARMALEAQQAPIPDFPADSNAPSPKTPPSPPSSTAAFPAPRALCIIALVERIVGTTVVFLTGDSRRSGHYARQDDVCRGDCDGVRAFAYPPPALIAPPNPPLRLC